MAEPVYRPVIMLARVLRTLMGWKVIVNGAENIPKTGPVILAINHAGYLDFIFSAWASVFEKKRWVRFLAKKEVFDNKISGPLMRGMKHIPVDRKNDPGRALDAAIEALRRGEVLGTFPEATINKSFVPGRGKTGTVRMAQASGATVVPAAVWGAHRIITKGHKLKMQRNIAILVNIGAPLELTPDEDPRAATDRLMDAIRSLLADAQQRYPQKPAGDDDRWWLPSHLGGSAPPPEGDGLGGSAPPPEGDGLGGGSAPPPEGDGLGGGSAPPPEGDGLGGGSAPPPEGDGLGGGSAPPPEGDGLGGGSAPPPEG